MFNKILIANRGEIACRIIKTAKRLGIESVAIFSSVDKDALHVKLANEAYCVGSAKSSDSYLRIEKIIEIAQQAGATAIHPGYGFLAENAGFAAACAQAKITFIGPSSKSITAMGSKSNAKSLMEKADVPLLPGYHGAKQDLKTFLSEAEKIGYPVLLKAVSGGGGKGMQIVNNGEEMDAALTSAQRIAKNSFDDDQLLLEKYLQNPRHVEMQIMADSHGNYLYLFERDCSIQRRHQKIIEEAPAPKFSEALRKKMGEAAIKAAKAIDYVGAGTIEFLFADDQFYFMEMNTRLQVEHPVTEMITGFDLVELQLRVAAGEKLKFKQSDLHIHGHAIESRIYAEDPLQGFIPSIGKIHYLQEPAASDHVRVDSGVTERDSISQYYDPMIAKLICWGETREEAIRRMHNSLMDYHIIGVKNNVEFLKRIFSHADFKKEKINTAFIEAHEKQLLKPSNQITDEVLVVANLYLVLHNQQSMKNLATVKNAADSPWFLADGWHNNLDRVQTSQFVIDGKVIETQIKHLQNKIDVCVHGKDYQITGALNDKRLSFSIAGGITQTITIYQHENHLTIFGEEATYELQLHEPTRAATHTEEKLGSLSSPMPGTVVSLLTEIGKKVKPGDKLIIIEAMKMEHTIAAPKAGKVTAIHYRVGETVDEGAELITLED